MFVQVFITSPAHFTGLSFWQTPQAFESKRNEWLRTFTSANCCAILGIWHPTHSFPALPAAWWVCASMDAARGPFGDFVPWHSRQITFAGLMRSALFSVPWTS